MPAVLVLALALGALLVWLGRRQRAAAGLPEGRILSQDMVGRARSEDTLYDPVLDLAGRPDYLVEHDRQLIPMEVKSGPAQAGPRRSHRMQLAAYCRLVEAVYARRPAYGILQYADRSYAIPYTAETESELTELLRTMRLQAGTTADRSHNSSGRCQRCTFLQSCDQALA